MKGAEEEEDWARWGFFLFWKLRGLCVEEKLDLGDFAKWKSDM
jgi:hypothetical protein